jgi:hypothetical protein
MGTYVLFILAGLFFIIMAYNVAQGISTRKGPASNDDSALSFLWAFFASVPFLAFFIWGLIHTYHHHQ